VTRTKTNSSSNHAVTPTQSAWETVKLARHSERPHASHYIHAFSDFDELHGDRMYSDCRAVIAGTAMHRGRAVMLLGQEKGHDLESRLEHNFGMPRPEAYRKAGRCYRLAERYHMPVIIFLDSPGAHAGISAEQHNQSEAIATNIVNMAGLKVPILVYVIGEAMSGGAMAMGVSDYTAMLSHSVYSVISPEGCSGILWKDKTHMATASEMMAVTAPSLLERGFIDRILPEPQGGAHCDSSTMLNTVFVDIDVQLNRLCALSEQALLERRHTRLLSTAP
jgi:acetyl-CoA carboxylase carboxyl transferase subunit alpha